ncbi:MAG TPA: hypothetical protein DC042_07240 [Bacteroidales bacterium]|nr:hypothetical protein [Bacteroidales bacterium]
MSKRKRISALFFAGYLAFSFLPVMAQNDTVPPITVGAGMDIMSRYIWRGQDYGQTPSFQPGLSATWRGFTLGAWGAYKVAGKGLQETDLYLSKTFGFVTLAIWDYWSFDELAETDFFNYRNGTTSHALDASITLSGGETLPLNFLVSYMFYGADPSRSLYLELQYEHSFNTFDLQAFVGYQAKGEYYGERKGFVNIGCTVSKSIDVTESFSVPFSLSLVANPIAGSAWLVAGFSF